MPSQQQEKPYSWPTSQDFLPKDSLAQFDPNLFGFEAATKKKSRKSRKVKKGNHA